MSSNWIQVDLNKDCQFITYVVIVLCLNQSDVEIAVCCHNSEDLSDVTDDVWLANRTSFRVRSLRIEIRLIVANQNRTQIHAIVYKQKPSL